MANTQNDVFMARQPILDRNGKVWGYELLFRDKTDFGQALVKSNLNATARVIANTFNHFNVENILGDGMGLVNVDHTILSMDFIQMLPKNRFYLEILEDTRVDDDLVRRVTELKGMGFKFALDDFDFSRAMLERFMPLFHLVSIIKVDLFSLDEEMMGKMMPALRKKGLVFLAEKVENEEVFQKCMDLEFTYFQGYYFKHPELLEDRSVEPSRIAVLELIDMLRRDVGTKTIVEKFKQYPELTITLLRYLNSAHINTREEIKSILGAVTMLGKSMLMHWLSVFLYADVKDNASAEVLLECALFRGHMMSWILRKQGNAKLAEEGFMTGILSLVDALFRQPMASILSNVRISVNIADALDGRNGELGGLLALVEAMECRHDDDLIRMAPRFGLTVEELREEQTRFYSMNREAALL